MDPLEQRYSIFILWSYLYVMQELIFAAVSLENRSQLVLADNIN